MGSKNTQKTTYSYIVRPEQKFSTLKSFRSLALELKSKLQYTVQYAYSKLCSEDIIIFNTLHSLNTYSTYRLLRLKDEKVGHLSVKMKYRHNI